MTVRHGQEYVVSTFNQFRNKLDVDEREIAETLPEEKREEIIGAYNNTESDADNAERSEVESIDELPEWAVKEYLEYVRPLDVVKTIQRILDARDSEFTYVWNRFHGQDVHTIVEIPEWQLKDMSHGP